MLGMLLDDVAKSVSYFSFFTDRFEIGATKTNPGLAHVHCSFISDDPTVSPDSLNIAGEGLLPVTAAADDILSDMTAEDRQTLNRSFLVESIGEDDVLYCYVGNLSSSTGVVYVRLPEREYFGELNSTSSGNKE